MRIYTGEGYKFFYHNCRKALAPTLYDAVERIKKMEQMGVPLYMSVKE